jgi:hypothetical protein
MSESWRQIGAGVIARSKAFKSFLLGTLCRCGKRNLARLPARGSGELTELLIYLVGHQLIHALEMPQRAFTPEAGAARDVVFDDDGVV